jgi:hypothetical protein
MVASLAVSGADGLVLIGASLTVAGADGLVQIGVCVVTRFSLEP